MKLTLKYIAIVLTVLCGVMIYVHYNDPEVTAWIIAFAGWINQAIDRSFELKKVGDKL
jgi:hypothetical protein